MIVATMPRMRKSLLMPGQCTRCFWAHEAGESPTRTTPVFNLRGVLTAFADALSPCDGCCR
jgi:hypothetical protein